MECRGASPEQLEQRIAAATAALRGAGLPLGGRAAQPQPLEVGGWVGKRWVGAWLLAVLAEVLHSCWTNKVCGAAGRSLLPSRHCGCGCCVLC